VRGYFGKKELGGNFDISWGCFAQMVRDAGRKEKKL
jgi:hypothetical protein